MDPTEDEGAPEGVETPETPEVVPSMLDAINEALAPTVPVVADPLADETDEEEDDAEGEEEGDETRARDKDGKFLPKAGDAPKLGPDGKPLPVEAAKLGPDGKPLPTEPAKKADPVNDPIPEDVKGRTRERMTSLITAVKEKDEMIAVQNQLFDSIKSTGATPEEFGAMVGYMRWVHSDKPEDLKQARELLMHELRAVSLKLGEAAPGVDFVAEHADLQTAVDNGQMTVEAAQEMALHRSRVKTQTERQAAERTAEQSTQAATAERNGAIADLDALGKTLNATDPDFATKHEILQPVLASLGMLPPSKWKAAFTGAYKAITPAQVARFKSTGVAPAVAPLKGGQQPLRANKSPSGDAKRTATSLHDAMFGEGFPE